MSGSITFNPYGTSTPQSTFQNPSFGRMQGTIDDDTVARMHLMGGVLAAGESVVMWGGRPIGEQVNVTLTGNSDGLGPQVASSTSTATCTGWTTWAASMVLIPGGAYPPVAGVGNFIGFYRYGSLARMVVACDPALVTTISPPATNVVTGLALYWDPVNYRITLSTGGNWALPTSTKLVSTNSGNSKIVTYSGGQASWVNGAAAVIQI